MFPLTVQGSPSFSSMGHFLLCLFRDKVSSIVRCLSLCGVRPYPPSPAATSQTDRRTCDFQPWRSLGTLAFGHLTRTTACIIFVIASAGLPLITLITLIFIHPLHPPD